jgi:hypothetical protein
MTMSYKGIVSSEMVRRQTLPAYEPRNFFERRQAAREPTAPDFAASSARLRPALVAAPHLFHGSMFGVAVQEGLIDRDASIQIGIRTPSPPSPKLHVLTADRCLRMDGKAIAGRATPLPQIVSGASA